MIRNIRPQLQALHSMTCAVTSRRTATTHRAPLNVTTVKAKRTWRDTLDVSPLEAAFRGAASRAMSSGNGELVEVRFVRGNKNVRREFDGLMECIRERAAEQLGLDISWESASADPVATIRHAMISPKL